jgi:hypothetical protein
MARDSTHRKCVRTSMENLRLPETFKSYALFRCSGKLHSLDSAQSPFHSSYRNKTNLHFVQRYASRFTMSRRGVSSSPFAYHVCCFASHRKGRLVTRNPFSIIPPHSGHFLPSLIIEPLVCLLLLCRFKISVFILVCCLYCEFVFRMS